MSNPPSDAATRDRSDDESDGRRSIANTGVRLVLDLAVVTLWVLFLALLFLQTAWPRWAFYAALLLGVAAYVTVTAPWTDER
ncbi:hypothetical protein [Natrarchaeobius oligotrophus]|uniref:DUF8119 domain-containing protein n=1 Tax=Natrarchaeobius chitinivorans TaxID=1679083 RepID=A0A3N6MGC1_NATCH|nr:hypothetical protein [Natrarchaeobius chitinivorans]RQH00035.1 hypothetical protein EA472_12545 [Natrarchaeobius chitinivorans]